MCVLGWACDRETEDAAEDARRKIRRETEEDGMNASGVDRGKRERKRKRGREGSTEKR